MRNVRTARWRLGLCVLSAGILVFLAVQGSLAVRAAFADVGNVGMLQVSGTFTNKFNYVHCPAGTPATSDCYHEVNVGDAIAGLGNATVDYMLVQDDFGSECAHVHALIPVLIVGKGEIDLTTRSTGCILPAHPEHFPPVEVTVSGGSGLYAGASGSGVLVYANHVWGLGLGSSTIAWTGTLNVAGLSFDTTPPQFAGVRPKTVKTRAARGTRVRYSVSATDATDGAVKTACVPKSGSIFRVGRVTVTCSAVDGSGNTATAHFLINVKRVRR
jgi:hypothetical protein